MNRPFIVTLLAAVCAGCATMKPDPKLSDKPVYGQIEAYRAEKGGYAMMPLPAPKTAEWQTENRAAIDAATAPAALDAVLATDASCDALCAEVKPGYAGDPLKLTQLAAVTVYVMERRNEAKRARWIAALERAKEASKTNDVDTFFVQQLQVCGK